MFSEVVEQVADSDDDRLLAELGLIEARRREDAAREAAVLAELDRRRVFRADGHASMWGLLRSKLHWSDRECRESMRLARLVDDHPDIGEALFETWVSVANAGELARAWARPAVHDSDDPVTVREFGELARLVQRHEHHEARLAVREFEARRDRTNVDATAAGSREARNAQVHVTAEGGELAAQLDPLAAIEIAEIFSVYVNAEWRTDHDTATARHGERVTVSMLDRTDAQRRADALLQIFRDAASRSPDAVAPEPVVTIHVDHATFSDLMVEAGMFPERDVDPFDDPTPHVAHRLCRTDGGHALDQATVLRLLMEARIRYVIRSDHGIPIRWGRRRRLFTGAARDAVRVLATRCTHPGCRVPLRRTHTDHTIDWSHGGPTDPDNGNPRCPRHNRHKNHGYTVQRDPTGLWHTYRPDGTEIR